MGVATVIHKPINFNARKSLIKSAISFDHHHHARAYTIFTHLARKEIKNQERKHLNIKGSFCVTNKQLSHFMNYFY